MKSDFILFLCAFGFSADGLLFDMARGGNFYYFQSPTVRMPNDQTVAEDVHRFRDKT